MTERNQKKIDWVKLSTSEIKDRYLVEVKNRYECLSMEMDEQSNTPTDKWNCLKLSIQHANENTPKIEKKAKQKMDDR